VLVAVGVAVGLALVVLERFGPLQAYVKAPIPPAPAEVRLTIPPAHMGVLLEGAAVGTVFTVTVTVAVLLQPPALVPVTV